jgi:hypothetical protein
MKGEKMHFIGGIVLGVFLSAIFFFHFAPRYETVQEGEVIFKQDRWTDRSWRLTNDEWEPLGGEGDRDWEEIDRALVTALRLPFADTDAYRALGKLQEQHPALAGVKREELLERLNVIYLRQVLVNMYLDDFLTMRAR